MAEADGGANGGATGSGWWRQQMAATGGGASTGSNVDSKVGNEGRWPAVAAEVGLQSSVMKQHGCEVSFSGCTCIDHNVSNSKLSLSTGQGGGAIQ